MRIVAGVATDTGRVRSGNEDSFVVEAPLYAVADGMGGARAGEVASQLALRTITELQRDGQSTLEDEIREANRVVFEQAGTDERYAGMGTTVTAALASAEALHVAHVGDSRAYLLRAGALRQLTRDHTLVDRMVEAGEISRDEADVHPHRNVLLRALGTESKVDVDAFDVGVLDGDRLLLCSDGLTTMVAEDQIVAILEATPGAPQDAADRLVRAANRAGGVDNITALVLDVEPGEPDDGTFAPAPPSVPERRYPWRAIAIAAAVVVLVLIAYTAFRSYVDNQWYVGVNNGHVAVFQGIPASPFGIELSHVDQETSLDAAAVQELPSFEGLGEGITADSREAALSIVSTMEDDLRASTRPNKRGGGQ